MKEKLKFFNFDKHRDMLEGLYNDYLKKEKKIAAELNEKSQIKRELKRKLRSGVIDSKQYQKTITELKKRTFDLKIKIDNFGRYLLT